MIKRELVGGALPFLARARGRRRADRWIAFLEHLNTALEDPGSHEDIARSIARACVPIFSSAMAIILSEERRLSVLAKEDIADPDFANAVIRARSSEILKALDARETRVIEGTSGPLLAVPLVTRDRAIGLALFGGRVFDAEEISVAHEVSRRATLAIGNALSYEKACLAIDSRDRMLAIVAHDIRNPIAAIELSSKRIVEDTSDTNVARHATIIRRCARHVSSIVDDLVDVSRFQSGGLVVDRRPELVREIVESAVTLASSLAETKSIALDVQLPDGDAILDCDRRRLLQALCNILGNALKFTPENGRVAVRCFEDTNHVSFTIADEGPGIPDEHVDKIFEPFWRGERRGEGLGLGLFITKAVVLAHGGTLTVKSDRGAIFVVTIPRTISVLP